MSMRKLFLGLVVGGSVFAAGFAWAWWAPGGVEARVMIPNGLSASETAALLKREGILRSVLLFKLYAKLTRMDRSLKPGEYLLTRPMAVHRVLARLHEGSVAQVRVVIPEGFMARQIADRLEALEITKAGEFMDFVRARQLEGFLFPTTYFFAKGLAAESVALSMYGEFKRHIQPIFDRSPQKRFTLKQVVTLASIVQREAAASDEMPMIASVYLNRLESRMKLEADPTVQYAMGMDTGKWFQGLRYKHLDNRSKYNTYIYRGLPPGPICSPGAQAVAAVLGPAQSDRIYFVADNTGRHLFSRTLEEHNRAREKVKAERRRLDAKAGR